MITPKQIKEKTMTPEKRAGTKDDLFAFYFARPVSYVISVPFLEAGINANTVSFLSMLPSILGFFFLGFGKNHAVQITGASMYILWGVLDCVDGDVARYTEKTSTMGKLWDAASGYMAMALMLFAAGVSVMHSPSGPLAIPVPDYFYVVLGGLSAFLVLYVRLVMNKKMQLYSAEAVEELNNPGTYSLIKTIARNLTAPSGFVELILLLSVIFHCTREFTLIYFAMHFVITVSSMRNLMRE